MTQTHEVRTVGVHKKDAEGIILIDALTGAVVTDQHERPEWAKDLTIGQLAERHLWYTNRMGAAYSKDMQSPEMLAFEDLGWLTFAPRDEAAEDYEMVEGYVAADEEHRMDVLAALLTIDRTADTDAEAFAGVTNIVAETEIMRDDTRTEGELSDLLEAQGQGFSDVTAEHLKTGTDGR